MAPRDHADDHATILVEARRLSRIRRRALPPRPRRRREAGVPASRPGTAGHGTSIAKPSSAGIKYSDEAGKRAAASGLVRTEAGRTIIGCGPETVHWAFSGAPRRGSRAVKPGAEVTVDTVSHEGILADQGDPVGFFARFGIPAEEVLADAVAVYTKAQHSGLGGHIVSGPVYVEGAEPGDVLVVRARGDAAHAVRRQHHADEPRRIARRVQPQPAGCRHPVRHGTRHRPVLALDRDFAAARLRHHGDGGAQPRQDQLGSPGPLWHN